MPWTRPQPATSSFADVPVASINLGFAGAFKVGDLVVIGVASTPGGAGYVATDDAPLGTFAWTSLVNQVWGGGLALGSILYAVATQAFTGMNVNVAPTPAGDASWVAIGGVYRHKGSLFSDQTSVAFGTGVNLVGTTMTPVGMHELAVAFGAYIPNLFFSTSDPPLTTRVVINFSVNMGMTMADALDVSAPFTPTMHLSAPGDWLITGVTFGANVPPSTGPPGQFLGSGLEPFPMRRMPERRREELRPEWRRYYRIKPIM